MASTSVTFRGGGQEEINRSVSSSGLAEPSLHARISAGELGSHTSLWERAVLSPAL